MRSDAASPPLLCGGLKAGSARGISGTGSRVKGTAGPEGLSETGPEGSGERVWEGLEERPEGSALGAGCTALPTALLDLVRDMILFCSFWSCALA